MRARGKHSGRIEVRPALKHLGGLRATMEALWVRACQEEGINPRAAFVVFSESNRFAPLYDRAARTFLEEWQAYQAGGYVGLTLNG